MIATPIKTKSKKKLVEAVTDVQKKVDLLEIWFDELKFDEDSIKKIFKMTKKPVIYKHTGSVGDLENILVFGPQYVDLDIATSKSVINMVKNKYKKTQIILSFHDFKKTPESKKIQSILDRMRKKGADIAKIATYAQTFEDSLRILAVLSKQTEKTILIGMGAKGKITRLTGHLLGNYLMYAATSLSNKTANGQLTIDEMRKVITLS